MASSEASGPRRRRGQEVRERVLRAALECFGAFGFEGTATRAVAERANVTHTLVLYHFQSKDQLWFATMQNALDAYMAEFRQHLEASKGQTARARLTGVIEQFVRLSSSMPQIPRILSMEGHQEGERLDWLLGHFLREHFAVVKDIIRCGQQEGSVRKGEPARIYHHITGGGGLPFTISKQHQALIDKDVFSEAEVGRHIAFLHDTIFV